MPAVKLSLDDFLALPETEPASELLDGEVVQKPMPTYEHGLIQSLLSFVLLTFLRAHPIGVVGSEVRCIFGPPGAERPYVPDLVFIRSERAPRPGRGQPFRGAPDLAVEILSPDDRPDRVAAKVAFYLLHGVRLVWLVDPDTRSVTTLTSDGHSQRLTADDALDGGAVLPGFTTPVRELFPAIE
ncbi:MAG: Uma2 family endonuclease [Dehalococcoidia bacterium]